MDVLAFVPENFAAGFWITYIYFADLCFNTYSGFSICIKNYILETAACPPCNSLAPP